MSFEEFIVLLALDIDGTLHPLGCAPEKRFCDAPRLETVLRDYPHVRIVIASDWRKVYAFEKIKEAFRLRLRERIVGVTPIIRENFAEGQREHELDLYLQRNSLQGTPWVALDDEPVNYLEDSLVVTCKGGFGEREEQALRAFLATPVDELVAQMRERQARREESDARIHASWKEFAGAEFRGETGFGSEMPQKTAPVILFLDFDGVLHPECMDEQRSAAFCFLPRFESVLRDFPQVKIVISSAWRRNSTLDELRVYFSEDLRERVIGMTGVFMGAGYGDSGSCTRQKLCLQWLEGNRLKHVRWVALDDVRSHFAPDAPCIWCANGFGELEEQALRDLLAGTFERQR